MLHCRRITLLTTSWRLEGKALHRLVRMAQTRMPQPPAFVTLGMSSVSLKPKTYTSWQGADLERTRAGACARASRPRRCASWSARACAWR